MRKTAQKCSIMLSITAAAVALLLLVVLLGVLGIYTQTESGQKSMAKASIALPFVRAESYGKVAYEHYQAGEYAKAGRFYERALSRKPNDYSFASSAAMAYITGGDNDRAAELLKKCVQIKPEAVEPYVYLLSLYPNANSRPWEVAQLLKQGYEKTGDERLKDAANAFAQG